MLVLLAGVLLDGQGQEVSQQCGWGIQLDQPFLAVGRMFGGGSQERGRAHQRKPGGSSAAWILVTTMPEGPPRQWHQGSHSEPAHLVPLVAPAQCPVEVGGGSFCLDSPGLHRSGGVVCWEVMPPEGPGSVVFCRAGLAAAHSKLPAPPRWRFLPPNPRYLQCVFLF